MKLKSLANTIDNDMKLKTELVKTLTRAAGTLLDNGAVITDVQSLGHRDLPVRRRDHSTGQAVYSSKQAFVLVF